MSRLGFAEQWIKLIMNCVTTKVPVKVNGELSERFVPQRVLRQGDPLSPYLFLLCAKVFLALLKKGARESLIAGVKVCHNGPSISHMLFADYSLILICATEGDSKHLQIILQVCEECSRQVINKTKSVVLFSRNTNPKKKNMVCTLLQVTKETTMCAKYLGSPVHVGRSKLVFSRT